MVLPERREKIKRKTTKLHHDWIIKPRLPWYKRISVLLSLAVVVSSITGSYLYLNYTIYKTRVDLANVSKNLNELEQKYVDLKTVKIKLQRELEVAKQSQVEVNGNLIDLHQKTQELTEQVDLYKRIMSANRASESISVENVQVRQLEQDQEYFLSWVLLQASKKRNLQQGQLDIKIHGKSGDTAKILHYSQVAVEKNAKLSYKFRDFQQFNKKIRIPDNFIIDTITVDMLDNRTKISKSKTYSWNQIGRQIHVAEAQIETTRLQGHS